MQLNSALKRVLPTFHSRLMLRRAMYLPLDLLRPMPGMVPPRGLRFDGGGDYVGIGRENLAKLVAFCGLRPGDRVLDVGCGIGRLAAPLTEFLTTGTYDGFDIVPEGIDWCEKNISARFPNFRFRRVDVYSRHYNPDGRVAARGFSFPYADRCFDFAILASVFTHMLPDGIANYCGELARVLRPGGRVWATCFVMTPERRANPSRLSVPIVHPAGGCWVLDPNFPESAVAVPRSFLESCFAAFDWELHFGAWAGTPAAIGDHDAVIARRRPYGAGEAA